MREQEFFVFSQENIYECHSIEGFFCSMLRSNYWVNDR